MRQRKLIVSCESAAHSILPWFFPFLFVRFCIFLWNLISGPVLHSPKKNEPIRLFRMKIFDLFGIRNFVQFAAPSQYSDLYAFYHIGHQPSAIFAQRSKCLYWATKFSVKLHALGKKRESILKSNRSVCYLKSSFCHFIHWTETSEHGIHLHRNRKTYYLCFTNYRN